MVSVTITPSLKADSDTAYQRRARSRVPSGRDGLFRRVKIGHRFEPVAAGLAFPQVSRAVRALLEPFRHGDRLAALRARIFTGQVFGLQSARTDSDHDASPFCDLARKSDASIESLSRRPRVAILSDGGDRRVGKGASSR